MKHRLPLERRTLHGHFSRDLEPVVAVDSGDTVQLETLESGWHVRPGEYFEPRDPELDDGHALCGPIEVRGARPGLTLVVEIRTVRTGPWGATSTWTDEPEPHVLLWELDADAGIARWEGRTVDLAPFAGVVGMPPPDEGRHSTVPPRVWGGNIDCKELVAGTTLYLPIPVDGALLSAGDGHGCQGDGEVCGTAIECPLEVLELGLSVEELGYDTPVARTSDAWITFGFDEDLDAAVETATGAMLELMQREHGVTRTEALMLASLVVDLRVTQIVNGVRGAHAVLPDNSLR